MTVGQEKPDGNIRICDCGQDEGKPGGQGSEREVQIMPGSDERRVAGITPGRGGSIRSSLSSVFMWPIVASMADRRLSSRRIVAERLPTGGDLAAEIAGTRGPDKQISALLLEGTAHPAELPA